MTHQPDVSQPGLGSQYAVGKRVYIIHGFMATTRNHWFPWLRQTLAAHGAEAPALQLPLPGTPDITAWLAFLDANVRNPDADTYFVAHSLGCITVLRYLESLPAGTRIGGIVLVAGFASPIAALPQLDEFTHGHRPDAARVIAMCSHRSVIASRNDGAVPYAQVEELSRLLQADLLTVENGGHFLGDEGFTTLPIALECLRAMMQTPRTLSKSSL